MTAPENMDMHMDMDIEEIAVPQPPRLVRQRQVPRNFDFDNAQAARRLDFNVEEDNIPPPVAPRLVRQHAQIFQDEQRDEDGDVVMDTEGGSRKRRKTNRRKNKNTKRRRTNKRKSRGGSKKRRRSVRKSRRSRK